jgi:hypothetical protein
MRHAVPLRLSIALLALAALGSCVGAPAPAPAPPRPVPAPAPSPVRPRPAPAPAPARADWRDGPITPGNWTYRQDGRGSIALFGPGGGNADFTIRCDKQRGQVFVSRFGDAASPGPLPLTIRTTSTLRSLSALPTGDGQGYFAVQLAPSDPLLDAIGYSRGRFLVEGGGLPALVIPAWSEILRVVEDCRP